MSSHHLSLACAIINGVFALHAFSNGSFIVGFVALGFCAVCAMNWAQK